MSSCFLCKDICKVDVDDDEQRYCSRCSRWCHLKCLEGQRVGFITASEAALILAEVAGYTLVYPVDKSLKAVLMTPLIRSTQRIEHMGPLGNIKSLLIIRAAMAQKAQAGIEWPTRVQAYFRRCSKLDRELEPFFICQLCNCTPI